jgi:hypothetical protein
MLHFSIVISDLKSKLNSLAMTVAILEEKLSSKEKN